MRLSRPWGGGIPRDRQPVIGQESFRSRQPGCPHPQGFSNLSDMHNFLGPAKFPFPLSISTQRLLGSARKIVDNISSSHHLRPTPASLVAFNPPLGIFAPLCYRIRHPWRAGIRLDRWPDISTGCIVGIGAAGHGQ